MKKLLYGLLVLIALGAAAFIFYDDFKTKRQREKQGIGFEIAADTGLYCSSKGISVEKLRENQVLYFDVENSGEAGSVKESLLPSRTRLKAKVLTIEKSSSMNKKLAIFIFTHIVIGTKEIQFDGYISPDSNRPGDTLRNDGKFLGSFAGGEAGAGGIIAGFVLGDKAISVIRRHTSCPVNFFVSPGINSKTIIHVRAYKSVYIPLGLKNPVTQKPKGWFDRVIDFLG